MMRMLWRLCAAVLPATAERDVGESAGTFSSTGLTLRLKWSRVQAGLAYGLPLIHPAFVSAEHGSWQDHGIHAQIALTL